MTTMIDNEDDIELDMEAAGPLLDAFAEIGDNITKVIQDEIAKNPLIAADQRTVAFASVCQMLSMNAMLELAEEVECDPLEIVDTWANAFYEAFDVEEDDEEEEA